MPLHKRKVWFLGLGIEHTFRKRFVKPSVKVGDISKTDALMPCERSTMQLMGNGICKDKEHSSSHQHTTVTLGHQTKTSRHHQEGTWCVCAGVLPSSWVSLREAMNVSVSLFGRTFRVCFHTDSCLYKCNFVCVWCAQQFALCKSCQGEKDEGEERTVRGRCA